MEDEWLPGKIIMKVKVSIIVPVYNAEKTLGRCINSILRQTYAEWEMIIIDDGSTDLSGQLCEQYALQDSRITVIHQDNKGVSAARNVGIDVAKGIYLIFVDSDDEIISTFLADYIEVAEREKSDVVIGGYTEIENDGNKEIHFPTLSGISHQDIWEVICRKPEQFGYLWNKLFMNDIVQKCNLRLRTDLYSQEDLEFCLRYFDQCKTFSWVSNTDYQYYKVIGRRVPPVWDFIENQLKLIKIAQKKVQLTAEAGQAVADRIILLIYSYLYNVDDYGQFKEAIAKLEDIDGLKSFLTDVKPWSENNMVAWLFVHGKNKTIFIYFKTRNKCRDLFKKGRSVFIERK